MSLLGWRGQVRAGVEVAGLRESGRVDEGGDVIGVVPGRCEVVGRGGLGEDGGEELVVVPSEVARPIVREQERRGRGVVELDDVRCDLGPAERPGPADHMVPGHDVSGARLDHDGLLLPEPRETGRDSRDIADPGVARVELDAREGDRERLQGGGDARAIALRDRRVRSGVVVRVSGPA